MNNEEIARANGLWVGKEVWDSHRYLGVRGIVSAISGDKYPVIVQFGANQSFYTTDRRWHDEHQPTLSDEPYEIPITINRHQFEVGDAVLYRDEDYEEWLGGKVGDVVDGNPIIIGHTWSQVIPFDFERMGTTD